MNDLVTNTPAHRSTLNPYSEFRSSSFNRTVHVPRINIACRVTSNNSYLLSIGPYVRAHYIYQNMRHVINC